MTQALDEVTLDTSGLFYRELINNTADAIVAIDCRQTLVFANRASEDLFGYHADDILGKNLDILLPSCFREVHAAYVDGFASSSINAQYMGDRKGQVVGRHADGRDLKLGATIVRIQNGKETLFAAIMRDIGWQVELVDKLTDMAREDPLTRLLNRRSFEKLAKAEEKRAQRDKTSLSFLFIDIDHFKDVNDRHGHGAGDVVLKELGRIASQSLRGMDLICRWGGGEFVGILPNTDFDGAKAVAERIRRAIEDNRFILPSGASISVTASIGISHAANDAVDVNNLIEKADKALYQAKRAGRNRVSFAG
ncbi:sensor domain-containing diguanylate cyclase [Nisaea sp.]|uniref:GGDEF domain-containing protein n=1 Tax=Nisaea sp. TaxID=2024842 RepID=UPI002B2735C0|nr:sensor domain-containing diguanylate cyclase [Nisaea sp.]